LRRVVELGGALTIDVTQPQYAMAVEQPELVITIEQVPEIDVVVP